MSGISFVSKDVMLPGEEDRPNPEKERPDEAYDGRPLWERLAENKRKEMEAEEERMRMSNHVKVIDEDEMAFLHSVEEEDRRKEREIAEETRKALEQFREAGVTANRLPTSVKTSDAAVSNARPARPVDQQKSILSNLVHVKKKQKTGDAEQDKVTAQSSSHERKMRDEKDDDETERPRKLSMTDTAAPASTTVLPKDSAIRNLLSAYGDSDDDGDASD